jgi:hypothetical protein
MAVGDFLRPQRSPLSVYDEQMAEMLRQQSAGIGARDIAAESALGFPVGTMTAKILGNVLASAKEKSALNRDEQSRKARSLLARITSGNLPDNVTMDESGNFSTIIKEAQRIEQPPEELQQATYGRGLEGQMAGVPAQVIPEVTEKGMVLKGTGDSPNLLERTFFGDIKDKKIQDRYDLIEAAGYDPYQFMRQELRDAIDKEDRTYLLEQREQAKIDKIFDDTVKRFNYNKNKWKFDKEKEVYQHTKDKTNKFNELTELMNNKKYPDIYTKMNDLATAYINNGFQDEGLALFKTIKDLKPEGLTKADNLKWTLELQTGEKKKFAGIKKVVDNLQQLKKGFEDTSGAASYSLMIKFIKALDDSVVREGEVRTFGTFLGLITNIENEYSKFTGDGFTEEVKRDMYALTLEAAKTLMNDYNNNKISFINDFIVPEGFNPERVYAGISALDTRDLGLPALVDVTGKPIYTDEESEFKSDTVSLNKNNKSQKISGNVVTLNNGISVTLPEDFEGDEKDAKNYALNLIYQNDKDKNAIQYFQNVQEIQKLRKQMSNLPSNDMENINKLQEQIDILEDENLFLTKE